MLRIVRATIFLFYANYADYANYYLHNLVEDLILGAELVAKGPHPPVGTFSRAKGPGRRQMNLLAPIMFNTVGTYQYICLLPRPCVGEGGDRRMRALLPTRHHHAHAHQFSPPQEPPAEGRSTIAERVIPPGARF